MSVGFAERLLAWFARCGRHDLPWQDQPTPYRVWVSEIMLQQTQVTTVIPYFERFMTRFPDVSGLADAHIDEVLHLWSGLGYYARARNLHKAARIVREAHSGRMPETMDELMSLPGIGRSTAGAILALSLDERQPILDGNVKRVLCRHAGIEGWPGRSATATSLWQLADRLTPEKRCAAYTQAIMDLGATVCRRSRPLCQQCPVAEDCIARREDRQAELPAPRPRRERPSRAVVMLIVRDPRGRILLQRRPATGVWAGLWIFPELPAQAAASGWCRENLGLLPTRIEDLAQVSHGFTHFTLQITPRIVQLDSEPAAIMEAGTMLWYNPEAPARIGIAAVVERLLTQVAAGKSISGEQDGPDGQLRITGH
ncbi:MAG: A/G-specific adenine glycosylase [Chromatiales bacterium]|jgi:A/G-specific adenine glycosylase|nr:A/G-specific adenine glycosylase [Chromatiales bacterium]